MTIRIAIPDMVSPSYFPAIAAVELGFMEEQGLDASIELLGPVTATYEALRDGQIAYAGGAAHAPLYAFKDWQGCRLLCALSQNMYWFLVLRADIAAEKGDLTALRGLRIGAALGPVDGLTRMLRDVGLDPEKGYFGLLENKQATLVYTSGAFSPGVPGDAFGVDHQSTYMTAWLNQAGVTDISEIRYQPTILTTDSEGDFARAKAAAAALADCTDAWRH